MGLPNYWQGTRGIMPLLIIRLVCWFGWFSSFAFAQLDISGGITGSVNFPSLGITCISNLAVFVTSLIRHRIDLDIGARCFIDILTSPKLEKIDGMNGHGLTTSNPGYADVVMLSKGAPNSSMTEFIQSNANRVDFILLQYVTLLSPSLDLAAEVKRCPCGYNCDCIVFYTVEEITKMLADRMPGTLKPLSHGLCLLPCLRCLENSCHRCSEEGMIRVEGPSQSHDGYRLGETDSKVVCKILPSIKDTLIGSTCICIPMEDARSDEWTKLLVKLLRSKDAEGRGERDGVSQVLENYLAGGEVAGRVQYNIAPLIMTRLAEVSINLLLTFFLGVDGFSSAVVARRTMRGSDFAANAFLSEARVECNDSSTQVCQVLTFRGNIVRRNIVGMRSLSIIVGCVNLVCSLGWTVLIALKGSADISPPLSMPRVAVIIAAIGIILAMDLSAFYFYFRAAFSIEGHRPHFRSFCSSSWRFLCDRREACSSKTVLYTVIILEIVCLVSGSVVAGTLGIKAFGRWVYGVIQALVWVKWGFCCYLLDKYEWRLVESPLYFVGSSAFFLNAVLAGVRCKWEPGPWKFDSRKFGPGGNGN